MRKWFIRLFLVFSLVSFSSAQNTKKQNQISWEYLEISVIDKYCGDPSYSCRHYYYFNSGIRLNGPVSTDWLNNTGWELTDNISNDGALSGLLFKRIFNKGRTEKEIEWLSKELSKEIQTRKEKKSETPLIDLDTLEAKQNLADFNQAEEKKMRTALEQIKDFPLKIISVSSDALALKRSRVGAEIVLDGTFALLKEGNQYRSSETDKYFKEAVKQILDKIGASGTSYSAGNAAAISGGGFNPKIGNFSVNMAGLTLKVSVTVNYLNQQIIVAQGWISSKWIENPQ